MSVAKYSLSVSILLTALLMVGAAVEETSRTRSLLLRFTYTAAVDPVPEKADIDLWIPVPSDGRWQKVRNLTVDSASDYQVTHDEEYGNRMVYLRRQGSQSPLIVRVHFEVERKEVKVLRPDGRQEITLGWSPDCSCERETCGAGCQCPACQHAGRLKDLSVKPNLLIPIGGRFGQLAERVGAGKKSTLEKVRAFFEHTVDIMSYDYNRESPKLGQGDAEFVCDYRKGNCSDIHSYLISLCRTSGIPAYLEYGFPIAGIPVPQSLATEGKISGYHCWTWVYAESAGWLPVDASDARRWLDHGKKETADYLFGNLLLERSAVAVSRGRDITLRPAQKGSVLNYFIYPYAEVKGKPENVSWQLTYQLQGSY